VSAFSRAGRIDPLRHRALPNGESLFEYVCDMTRQILTGNVIGTSTVVLRRDAIEGVRFRTEYRRAGEDYLSWLALAQRGAHFCFNARPVARYGRGVNVYSGARWGTAEFTATAQDELRYKLACLVELDLAEDLRHHLMREVERLCDAWVAGCLHRVLRLRPMPLREVLRQRRLDPRLWQRLERALAAKGGLGRSPPN
jgi:succinoglycan biosynthesis protein ExoW